MKKNFLRKMALVMSSVLLLSTALTGCGGAEKGVAETEKSAVQTEASAGEKAEVDRTGKTPKEHVTVAYRNSPNGFIPNSTNGGALAANMLSQMIYDRLIERDPETGEFVPSLAESWEQVDDTTLVFHLRDDVFFHNDEKLTAEDVVYSFITYANNAASASYYKMFDTEETKALDETTVQLKLKYPFGALLSLLASPRGLIICKSQVEEVGLDEASVNAIGSGPLELVELVIGDHVDLTRNDEYWGEKTSYKDFTLRVITETSTRAIEVETGGVDVALNIDANSIDALRSNPDITVISGPSWTFMDLKLNCMYQEKLTPEIRQAMMLAIDTNAVNMAVYGEYGQAEPAPSTMTCSKLDFTHKYDPEKAKELIAASDWDTENDVLDFYVNNTSEVTSCAEIIANMWGKVGLKTEIHTVDQAGYSALFEGGESTLKDASAAMIVMSCSYGDLAFEVNKLTGGWLYAMNVLTNEGENKDLYQLCMDSAGMYDEAERTAAYTEIFSQMEERGIQAFLLTPHNISAYHGDVEGFYNAPNSIPNLSRMTVWE